jgi:hypothetical protein
MVIRKKSKKIMLSYEQWQGHVINIYTKVSLNEISAV